MVVQMCSKTVSSNQVGRIQRVLGTATEAVKKNVRLERALVRLARNEVA